MNIYFYAMNIINKIYSMNGNTLVVFYIAIPAFCQCYTELMNATLGW